MNGAPSSGQGVTITSPTVTAPADVCRCTRCPHCGKVQVPAATTPWPYTPPPPAQAWPSEVTYS